MMRSLPWGEDPMAPRTLSRHHLDCFVAVGSRISHYAIMKLAITSPNRDKYSETFIRMQMDRLPCELLIYGRPLATETDPGGPVVCRGVRGLASFAAHGIRHGFSSAALQEQELKRRLRQRGIDLLLANYGPAGVALQPLCAALSIPLVVHFHGFDAHAKAVLDANRAGYEALGRQAARIVVVSELMAESVARAGIPSGKIRVVRYGVDPTDFQAKQHFPQQPMFLGVGRFVDKKAPNLTVMAFKEVHRRFPKARLILAGDGVLLESTRNLAVAVGLGDAVSFPGVLERAEVAQRMHEATAFVQHSLCPNLGPSAGDCEGTPVAVLEAMMIGLPVIATRHAGIGEVVKHGRSGLLFEERDVEAMSAAMIHLAVSPQTAASMGRAARTEALEHYSAENYTDSLQRILESVKGRWTPAVYGEESVDGVIDQASTSTNFPSPGSGRRLAGWRRTWSRPRLNLQRSPTVRVE